MLRSVRGCAPTVMMHLSQKLRTKKNKRPEIWDFPRLYERNRFAVEAFCFKALRVRHRLMKSIPKTLMYAPWAHDALGHERNGCLGQTESALPRKWDNRAHLTIPGYFL